MHATYEFPLWSYLNCCQDPACHKMLVAFTPRCVHWLPLAIQSSHGIPFRGNIWIAACLLFLELPRHAKAASTLMHADLGFSKAPHFTLSGSLDLAKFCVSSTALSPPSSEDHLVIGHGCVTRLAPAMPLIVRERSAFHLLLNISRSSS